MTTPVKALRWKTSVRCLEKADQKVCHVNYKKICLLLNMEFCSLRIDSSKLALVAFCRRGCCLINFSFFFCNSWHLDLFTLCNDFWRFLAWSLRFFTRGFSQNILGWTFLGLIPPVNISAIGWRAQNHISSKNFKN